MHHLFKATVLAVTMLAFGTGHAAPEIFAIDSNHTYPMFETSHLGISIQRGRFDKTTGKIVIDRAAQSGSVEITIDAASINMGFETWNKHMRGEDFFNTDKFAVMTYRSGKLIFAEGKIVGAEGEFTLLGVTKPLRLTVSGFACTEHPMLKKPYCGVEVTTRIKRSDFGMSKGIPFVGDDVRLIAPVEAIGE